MMYIMVQIYWIAPVNFIYVPTKRGVFFFIAYAHYTVITLSYILLLLVIFMHEVKVIQYFMSSF